MPNGGPGARARAPAVRLEYPAKCRSAPELRRRCSAGEKEQRDAIGSRPRQESSPTTAGEVESSGRETSPSSESVWTHVSTAAGDWSRSVEPIPGREALAGGLSACVGVSWSYSFVRVGSQGLVTLSYLFQFTHSRMSPLFRHRLPAATNAEIFSRSRPRPPQVPVARKPGVGR
jgi:hypothetical protein